MARNRIEELLVELKFQGGEELKKISGGFRELAKAVNLADADIEDARTKIIDYGRTLGNTNQAVKGTIQALKALQDSTQRGGEAWNKLSSDVLQFERAARLTDKEIESLRRGIVAEAGAHSQSETSIRAHVRALQELRAQSVLGGQVNRQLSQTIGQLTQQLEQAEIASRAHFSALNQALAVRPDAVLRQFQAYTQVLRDVRATAEQAAEAQQRLNQLAGAPRIAARRELVARAGIQADPAYQERFGLASRSLEALPDVPAALSLRLRELQEDLSFTTRNTNLYIRTLVEMASVQRQASASTQGFAAALREQLASGQLAPTQKNLQEVIGALRREMLELDTTTTEGGRAYAENARQADVLERQLNQLASSYRNVADMAVQAATAERSAAAARVTALYMNNRAVRDQAQAMSDLGNAVRSGIAGTPLMLPAAGQTSAPGAGLQVSGGARIGGPSGNIQRVLTPGTFPGERQQGPEISPEQADAARRAYLSTAEAAQVKAEAERMAAESSMRLRAEVDKAAQANNGSINSIQRYRDSLVTLRNTIPSTEGEFKRLTAQVQRLDAQLERAQRSRRRMSAMEATQAAGAVISGGIFGGPEGAIGGALGTAFGGVPGAFAGAAIGAQVGMIRQSLGQMAAFTAEIDKQRIALRNVVGTQAEYQNGLQFIDATSRRLAIPQDQLNKQFTQLSASVIGAGGNVDAAKLAFEGIAAGIRGTGGSLSDMDAALRATAQVFSKGKVSAEELRQQIGERLPGAFTLFAESIGKTPQQLDKMLESGEVGLNDFMKFVQALSARYGNSANEIAASSQAAGDRMQTTFARIRESVGRELQPIGAELQQTFARILSENESTFVALAEGLANVFKFFSDNKFTGQLFKFAIQFGAVATAVAGLRAAFTALAATQVGGFFASLSSALSLVQIGGVTSSFVTLRQAIGALQVGTVPALRALFAGFSGAEVAQGLGNAATNARITGDVMAASTTKAQEFKNSLVGLGATLRSLALIGTITLVVDVVIKQLAELNELDRRIKEYEKRRSPVGAEGPRLVLNAARRFTGTSREDLQNIQNLRRTDLAERLRPQLAEVEARIRPQDLLGQLGASLDFLDPLAAKARALRKQDLLNQIKESEEIINLSSNSFKTRKQMLGEQFSFGGGAEKDAAERAKLAQSFLQAVEQRENAIAQARIQLEEQAGEIRKQAVERANKLEEDFAQQRLSKEREIAQARRELAGVRQDIGFELGAVQAAATGGDPEVIRIEQRITEAARQRNEERIQLEQALLDEQTSRNRAIEEFKTSNATAVNEANARYAKAIGEAQREYARAVAKIIEEGTGRAGKRLETAGKIVAALLQQATAREAFAVATQGLAVSFDNSEEFAVGLTRYSASQFLSASKNKSPQAGAAALELVRATQALEEAQRAMSEIPSAASVVGPAINGITVNIDDLLESVNKAATGLDNLGNEAKVAFKELADTKFGQVFVKEASQALQAILGLSQNLRSEEKKTLGVLSLRESGMEGGLAERVYEINQAFEAGRKGLEAAFDKASSLTKDPKDLADLTKNYDVLKQSLSDANASALGLAQALANIPPDLQIRIAIQDTKDELDKLMDPAKRVIDAAKSIGDSFGNAFKGVVTGSMSAKGALASFFSSVADYFADMASRMIAQWIQLMFYNAIVSIFPSFGGTGGGFGAGYFNPMTGLGAAGPNFGLADGGVFARNNIVPYANGGIVNRPTMFKFANGGAMQTGVMGEAGPEAIMPLKRGADGKLGVAAGGSGSVNVTVNVDAGGTKAQGDTTKSEQLGRAVSQAVQEELLRQKRPGGLLA